jgi:hypothetical protein
MVEPIPDLIPDDLGAEIAEPRPVAVLRAQAALVGTKTGKRVLAEVVPLQPTDYLESLSIFSRSQIDRNSARRLYGFNLVVPALEKYTYQAFRVSYPVAEVYPVTLSGALVDPERVATNIVQFTEALRELFSSRQFHKVVNSLVGEAAAMTKRR